MAACGQMIRPEPERRRRAMPRWQRRAMRPSVLRPCHGECLILRANDTRIVGRGVARATGRPHAAGGPGECIEHQARALGPLDLADAERIGLLAALERLRRGSWRTGGRRLGGLAAVELVTVDARLIGRVCRWPVLPRKCTKGMAAKRLGVTYATITRWLCEGKLVARRARGKRHPSTRVYVAYPQTSRLLQRYGGPAERHPDRATRVMCHEPDVDWVIDRFRRGKRREHVVRLARWVRTTRGSGYGLKHVWVCPRCGQTGYQLYLPAGPMAKAGRTFGSWTFACRCCAGVASEAREWGRDGADGFGLWALKLSCGRVSGNEFRRGMGEFLSGQWDPLEILGLEDGD